MSSSTNGIADLIQIRRACRKLRRALPKVVQRQHALALAVRIRSLSWLWRARRVALYLARDGGLDLSPLMLALRQAGKAVYLPVLRSPPQRKLWFARHTEHKPLRLNRFAIPEPHLDNSNRSPPWSVDVVLVPLVAFDPYCNRLGMGGGFYDRTFAYRRLGSNWHRPRLIGIAHECQRVALLPQRYWDIPMDAIVTELYCYSKASTN